jgi:hypothetical protein
MGGSYLLQPVGVGDGRNLCSRSVAVALHCAFLTRKDSVADHQGYVGQGSTQSPRFVYGILLLMDRRCIGLGPGRGRTPETSSLATQREKFEYSISQPAHSSDSLLKYAAVGDSQFEMVIVRDGSVNAHQQHAADRAGRLLSLRGTRSPTNSPAITGTPRWRFRSR